MNGQSHLLALCRRPRLVTAGSNETCVVRFVEREDDGRERSGTRPDVANRLKDDRTEERTLSVLGDAPVALQEKNPPAVEKRRETEARAAANGEDGIAANAPQEPLGRSELASADLASLDLAKEGDEFVVRASLN